jgi:predicted AAA+ superfamily ATPase
MLKRQNASLIKKDLKTKIVLLTGPRQCGKTTLAKRLSPEFEYLNFDNLSHRLLIHRQEWDRAKPLIIFDELHKMDGWKRFLKGIYDVEGIPPALLVTGSAKLDVFRKVGDSLAGRFFKYSLHPFDVKELFPQLGKSAEEILDTLLKYGNFPEPFLAGKETFYRRWQKHHSDLILRQDLVDLSAIHDIPKIELLIALLRQRVGTTISLSNLGRDLEKDPNTIKRWLQLLENLYVIFRVSPYCKNIARSLLKDSKYYFYDLGQVKDEGAQLENLVACALLKELNRIEDISGYSGNLYFLRTKDGKEIDFLTVVDHRPTHMIEVKKADTAISTAFNHFRKFLPQAKQLQLVKDTKRNFSLPTGGRVEKLAPWLAEFSLEPIS